MQLSKRPSVYALPSYSLTGDLLGFLRCGLQYRYTRIGNLPASRPVQMWFGQFIHSVLEEAYRQYHVAREAEQNDLPPWPQERIDEICELVKRRLAAQRLFPWDERLERLGDARATAAINDLGPFLFPLIHRAEVRLTGARSLPLDLIAERYRFREADRYEMVGVIDVITHVELAEPALQDNLLVQIILDAVPQDPPGQFEIIIDYKGMRRPPVHVEGAEGPNYWDIYAWQVQTYAHLRNRHQDSLPIVAGAIIYLNELLPTQDDLIELRREIQAGGTDIIPEIGSETAELISAWRRGEDPPPLPLDFRLRRALRIVEIDPSTVQTALHSFDEVVARIETCRGKELQVGRVLSTWEKNATDENTCTRCDSRTFCPSYTQERIPRLPRVRA
ncbi:MAG: PD-(D/E)XK nuclease family protein [Chloroflexi bacterium]|nr:PD-(D/E)XK nuclease family protein [Chloroflexota bacterium]